ncbi:MAG: formylglycine-generating enzyme family protein, partial [Planctomycetes bacterium]|nr:formylglycine-generating enzyme family protein [Planctomycetota bacterium]
SIEPAASYEQWASPYGCINMSGNVAEWTATDGPVLDVAGKKVPQAVVCGGTVSDSKFQVMPSSRQFYKTTLFDRGLGFRCVQDLPK